MAKVKRQIITIDEEKCDGCGACVPSCAEGALRVVDGKARLMKQSFCDGLGACLGECPQGALHVVEMEVEAYDEPAVLGYLQHSNVRVALGPLNYVFSMAELHRWHHAKNLAEANTNYGSNLILWDLVFGSFFWPRDRKPPEDIGIPDLAAFPQTYWAQLTSPWHWRKIQAESHAGPAGSRDDAKIPALVA